MLMRIQRTLDSKCVWDHFLIWEKKFPCVKPQRVRMHCGVWECHIEGVFLLVSHVYTLQCLSEHYSLIQSTHQVLFLQIIYHHHLRSLAESPKDWHSRDPAAWTQKAPCSSPMTTDLLEQFPSPTTSHRHASLPKVLDPSICGSFLWAQGSCV